MRYNIGDKVIDIGKLDFMGNPSWFEIALDSISTVKKANTKYFSIYKDANMEEGCFIAGCNEYMYFYQKNGMQWSWPKPKILLHLEKDMDLIIDEINKIYEKIKKEDIERLDKSISYHKDSLKKYVIKKRELLNGTSLLGKNKQDILDKINNKK